MANSYIEKEADVLIVGGGLAGLWAAIRARDISEKVILVDKGKVARSGTSVFCHTTAAPIAPGQYEAWFKEQVERATYLADQNLVEIFLKEAGNRVNDMISWDVEFERNPDNSLRTEGVRGQKITRSALYTGRQMMEKMREKALSSGVEFDERVMICDLLTSDGKLPTSGAVTGALGINTRSADIIAYKAKGVVLATGCMAAKTNILYANGLSGDGIAMAFRAGAELVNMEMAVSHTFGIWNRKFTAGGQQQFLMNNSRIVNRLGERIMEKYKAAAKANNPEYDGNVEFGDICRAIAIENLEGRGPCYFDLRGWSEENIEKIKKVLPATMAAFKDSGIDVRKDLIESTPMAATYCGGQMSGTRINSKFETTISGLYASGVNAFAGGGISPQGFCNVSGYHAGESAALRAKQKSQVSLARAQVENLRNDITCRMKEGTAPAADRLYSILNKTVMPYGASFFKNEKRIISTLGQLEKIEKEELSAARASDTHELVKLLQFRNTITVLKIIYTSSLQRKESRYGFYREDYPYRDDLNWLKWTIARTDSQGKVSIRIEPVPFDKFRVRPDNPAKIPVVTQYVMQE